MTTTAELSPALQGLLDERLDSIERVLIRAGVSRGERRDIVQDVESQIYDELGRQTEGEPTRRDVLAVLAKLDPPESYAPEGLSPPAAKLDRISGAVVTSSLAVVGAVMAGVAAKITALGVLFGLFNSEREVLLIGLMLGVALALPASVCGVIACMQIVRLGRRGRGAAIFAVTSFPVLCTVLVAGYVILNSDGLGTLVMIVTVLLAVTALFLIAGRLIEAGLARMGERPS